MRTISIPVLVTWSSMMTAKLVNALRPSRLLVFFVSTTMLGGGLALATNAPVLESVGATVMGVLALRLGVMALSASADATASKVFDGTLEFFPEGLVLTRKDGSVAPHPWSWVLAVVEQRGVFVLRVDERRGRAFIFLRHDSLRALGALEPLRELLAQAGKLPAA